MAELTHLSLFSGIGGLDLAAEWAGFRTVGQCEWADFPRAVLEKHWPDVPKWRDIHDLTADDFFRRTGYPPGGVTCISGGFPCQPHSAAGKRQASRDERDMWPEFRRVVGEVRPRWVVAENVRGLLSSEDGRFFLGVLRDFAEMGYDVGWGVTSAAAAGAIHRRERVAIIAHAHSESLYGVRLHNSMQVSRPEDNLPTIGNQAFPVFEQLRIVKGRIYPGDKESYKSLVTRNDDGFSCAMDRNKSLGNAVVPQQFYPIFQAIAEVEGMLSYA